MQLLTFLTKGQGRIMDNFSRSRPLLFFNKELPSLWHVQDFIITPLQQMRSVWLSWETRETRVLPQRQQVCLVSSGWAVGHRSYTVHADNEPVTISVGQAAVCSLLIYSNSHLCLKDPALYFYIYSIMSVWLSNAKFMLHGVPTVEWKLSPIVVWRTRVFSDTVIKEKQQMQ